MCGIVYARRKAGKVTKLIQKRYQKQKERGQQGFGFVELKNGIVTAEIRTQTEKEILALLKKSEAEEILFHHRFPTSTPNVIESTHPIKVTNEKLKYNYLVVHNGIISNDEELRIKHLREGYIYTTDIKTKYITLNNTYYGSIEWNDSEALAIDFVQAIEGNKDMETEGSIAIIALQYNKKTGKAISLYYGRNEGNPLCVEAGKDFFSLSSETGTPLVADTLFKLDYKTGQITTEKKKIGKYQPHFFGYSSNYGNYGDGDRHNQIDDFTDYRDGYNKTILDTAKMEEDDFNMEAWLEVETLKEQMKKARDKNDYDKEAELAIELDELRQEIESMGIDYPTLWN